MALIFKWLLMLIYTALVGCLAFICGCAYEDKKIKERKNDAGISKRNL